jgi:transposase-like protein
MENELPAVVKNTIAKKKLRFYNIDAIDMAEKAGMQRCWAHKIRNVLDKVKKIDQPAVKKALTRISHASNRREATEAYYAECIGRISEKFPRMHNRRLTRPFLYG